jgi:LAGLIDADG DNA endonuclease family
MAKTGNFRLEFTFKIGFLNYCHWIKYALLFGLCTQTKPTPYPKNNPTQVWFSTLHHVYFTEIYNHWYQTTEKGKIKVIPSNDYLEQFFNEVSYSSLML